ncbi:MAG: exo 1,3/1,4-beta-D-glucan glucohydrolase [Bacteroidetes bacterium]|nr:exo 1,3/1,4-beta-D-glucan glucohydrolase [Bacteroidota bacterium]
MMKRILPALLVLWVIGSAGCDRADNVREPGRAHASLWPAARGGDPIDRDIEKRISELMSQMSVEEKVAQTIQGDINSLTPQDVRTYRLGSVLNGGNSAPNRDVKAPASEWLKLADAFYDASMDTTGGRLAIPVLWGTDAVHGHNNIVGATVFPHNIGLGAMRNPELIRRIGEVTATETIVTGQNWTFAPTLAVVRDDRWGRTYEGYSENPEVTASYAGQMVEGIQGSVGTDDFLGKGKLIASAKHFLGDGGTLNGKDQGDNVSSEEHLRDIHAAGYLEAVPAGVQTIMASFNTWQGVKMHGNRSLLQTILKDRMGFNGFVVGDWNGHGQVDGCTVTSCAPAFNAGLDMFMAPDSWKDLYENTVRQVESGEISEARLDDAVRRILRVKFRAGLFEKGRPSDQPGAGDFAMLGSDDHRAVARQAVRESMVLLKNNGGLLPLAPSSTILVAGDGANNLEKQTGGWTLSWQGTGNLRSDFPNGETIWEGLRTAVSAAGGTAVLSEDGTYSIRPDVAIVVFGENPYAEFVGDRENLDYDVPESDGLAILQKLKADGIPTVSVFVSGRPLWVNPELNASDSFVAVWLPGSEGGGVADVLLARADGSVRSDFSGKLSYSWPRTAVQTPLNTGDANYDPLFAYGFGLTYSDQSDLGLLPEESGILASADGNGVWFDDGEFAPAYELQTSGAVSVGRVDREAQEDSRQLTWTGSGSAWVTSDATDYTRESNGDMVIQLDYRIDSAPAGSVELVAGCGDTCEGRVDLMTLFQDSQPGEWYQLSVPLNCLAERGADMSRLVSPFGLRASEAFTVSISRIALEANTGNAICPN